MATPASSVSPRRRALPPSPSPPASQYPNATPTRSSTLRSTATPSTRPTSARSSPSISTIRLPSSSSGTSSAAEIASPSSGTRMNRSTGPITPTKALLRRIHRRSSVLPPGQEPPVPPLPTSKTAKRLSTQADQLHHQQQSAENTIDDVEDEEKAVWKEVEQLLDTVQIQNEQILELEKKNKELERELAAEKERSKAAREKSEKGLSRLSAIKVEKEFLSQEMILKGLQRDNEDKTFEVETLRRRLKTMTDFLAKQYGEEDWQGVVAAGTGSASLPALPGAVPLRSPEKETRDFFREPSAVARVFDSASPLARSKAAFPSRLGTDAMQQGGNPFGSDFASPQKLPAFNVGGSKPITNNDDVVIPTMARLASPVRRTSDVPGSTSDDADDTVSPAPAGTDGSAHDAISSAQDPALSSSAGRGPASLSTMPDFDPNVLLASIESVRLLVQGFERRNAIRRTEMEELIDRAALAEERAEKQKLKGAAGVAA